MLGLLVFLSSCGDMLVEKDLLERPQSKRCGDCHSEIFREWEEGRHAMAWKSEKFRLESENYTKTKCLSCHAPHQVDPEVKPVLREKFFEDGVSCVACHFKDQTRAMHGPHKVWSPPHPSKEDLSYIKSEFCAGCHRETYKEWKAAKLNFKVEKSCQDCHMPKIGEKRLVQKFPFEYFHSKKPRHDHSFPAGIAKPEDLRMEIVKEGNTYYLQITNVGIPHNLPTADQGDPKLYVVIDWGRGRTIKLLSPQSQNTLVYGKPMRIELPWEEPMELKVEILRRLSWKEERERISLQTFKIAR